MRVDVGSMRSFAALIMGSVHHEIVQFSGRVQGVGFRFAVLQLAKEYDISGFVENLPDGRVLLDLEGSPKEAAAFIKAIEERMHGFIRLTERTNFQREALYVGFEIR